MEDFWKGAALVLTVLVLTQLLKKQTPDLALVLTMAGCAMTAMAAMGAMQPVVAFLYRLEMLGDLGEGSLETLLKIAGIGIVTQTAVMLCADGGSTGLGKGLQLLGSGVMLQLSLPVMESLLELIWQLVRYG